MGWDKVKKSSIGRGNSVPLISIRKSEVIGINNEALEEFFDEDTEWVYIWYQEEEEEKIGIEPIEVQDTDSYKLSKTENGGSISCSAFLKENDLIPDETTKYRPTTENLNNRRELVVIHLDIPLDSYSTVPGVGESRYIGDENRGPF